MLENRLVVNTSLMPEGRFYAVVTLQALSLRSAIRLHAVALRAVSYVVLGCGATGGTVAPRRARTGHDVLGTAPARAVVAAVNAGGLRVEGRAGSFTVAVPAAAPDDLP